MSVVWERFAGREDRFAIRVALRDDPMPGQIDPEEGATWGSVQLWAQGKNLCAHSDQGETIESSHWYLLSLFEWVASNWDALFHEERLPARNEAPSAVESLAATIEPVPGLSDHDSDRWETEWYDWWERHAIRSCRNGGLFPDVVLRRWRDMIEVSWSDTPLAGAEGVSFLASNGTARLDPLDVAAPMLEVLEAFAEAMVTSIESPRFEALLRQVADIKSSAHKTTRLGWLAGIRGTAGNVRDQWERVERAFASFPAAARDAVLDVREKAGIIQGSNPAALIFGSFSPDITRHDVEAIANLLVDQYVEQPSDSAIDQFAHPEPIGAGQRPWQSGRTLADELADTLELDKTLPVDLDAILERLGVAVVPLRLDDPGIRGAAIAGEHLKPTILLNPAFADLDHDRANRFTCAHELCHLVFDRSEARSVAVASGPWAPMEIEQRANAFAAYFLLPPRAVRDYVLALDGPVANDHTITTTASHFGVSNVTLVEHLANIGLLTNENRFSYRTRRTFG